MTIASFLFASGTSPADKDGGAADRSPSECSDQAKRVYLVSTQNDLWSFDPGTLCTPTSTLFGFFPNVNQPDGGVAPMLAQIDKTSGATPANTSGRSSDVTRFRYSTNQTYDVVVLDTGMTIIGAGVSTCAPLVAPN